MGDIKTTFSADGQSLSQTVKNICAQFNSLKVQIGIAGQALQGFKQISDTVSKALPFKEVLDLGGELTDLSDQTGQSVKDLVILRQAFQNAGLGAEAVGGFAAKLQKSLGGMSEEGASTAEAFRRLGTSAAELRSMTLMEQIQTLTKGFARISNQSERTAIAMTILGKSGAKSLSLFADTTALSAARQEVGGMADVMDKSAKSFDSISDQLTTSSKKIQEIAAGFLTGVADQLEIATGNIAKTDMTGFGRSIGEAAGAVISMVEPLGKMKDQILQGVAAFAALRIGSAITAADMVKNSAAFNFAGIKSSVGQATAAIVGNFAAAGGGIKGFAEVGKLAFSSLGTAAKSCATAIKTAFLSNPIGLLLVAITEGVALFTKWTSQINAFGRALSAINDSTFSTLNTDDKKRANVTDTTQQNALAKEVEGQIEDYRKKIATIKDDYKDLSEAQRREVGETLLRAVNLLEQKLKMIKGITTAQMEQNARRILGEEREQAEARKAFELRKDLPKLEQELADARTKAETDGMSLAEKRDEILKKVNADSLDSINQEIDLLKSKGDLTNTQVLRENALIQAAKQLLDLKQKELAMNSAVKEAQERLNATKAETDALQTQSEWSKIALKSEQEYAKNAIDYTKQLQELHDKGVGDAQAKEIAGRQKQAADAKAAAERQRAEQNLAMKQSAQAIDIRESQLDAQHITAAEQYKAIEDSVFSTEEEKSRARVAAIDLENSHLESQIELLKERIALALSEPGHEDEAERMRAQVTQLESNIAANKRLSGELQAQQTYAGALRMQFTQMFDQTAFSAKNLAMTLSNLWSSAVDGISKGLTDVIFQAKSLTEAFREIAKTIVTDLVSSFIKMAIQYAAQLAFMSAIKEGHAAKNVASAQAEGAALTAAYTPAATVSSIATGGGSAMSGLIMAGIAIAGIVALVAGLKGFNEGGLIPGSPSSTDNRIARVATGEYIVNAGSVAHYGASLFEALNRRSLPRMSMDNLHLPSPSSGFAFATGGLVGPSAANEADSARQIGVNVAVINTRQDMRDFMQKEGKKHVVDIVSGAAWKLGI